VEVAVGDQLGRHRHPGLLVREGEAGHPGPAAQHVRRPGDHGDPAVPQLQQVPGRELAAVEVVRADGRHGRRRRAVGVDHHERDPPGHQLFLLLLGRAAEREQHPERAPVQDPLQPGRGGVVPAVELGEHDVHPGRAAGHLDAGDDLHRPGRVVLVQDQVELAVDGRRAPAAAPVAVPFQAGLDPGPGLLGDVGPTVQHLGDGGDGDPHLVGDGRHRGQHRRLGAERHHRKLVHVHPC
jgi:hypothetical protein